MQIGTIEESTIFFFRDPDPASEADKRSDPPAEGESVEAGGNGCED